jgi:hypothetical protein
MLAAGEGSILFTGASASVKGYANSAPFAMGKFALRGLADGAVDDEMGDDRLDPDAIAETYLHVHRQPRSAWTWEVELRPWLEKF